LVCGGRYRVESRELGVEDEGGEVGGGGVSKTAQQRREWGWGWWRVSCKWGSPEGREEFGVWVCRRRKNSH